MPAYELGSVFAPYSTASPPRGKQIVTFQPPDASDPIGPVPMYSALYTAGSCSDLKLPKHGNLNFQVLKVDRPFAIAAMKVEVGAGPFDPHTGIA